MLIQMTGHLPQDDLHFDYEHSSVTSAVFSRARVITNTGKQFAGAGLAFYEQSSLHYPEQSGLSAQLIFLHGPPTTW